MTEKQPKQENLLLNMLLNVVIPAVILIKFSGESNLGPRNALLIALAFPITYGLLDFRRAQRVNLFSVLGIISISLTGGISLLELDPKYIAIKEAAIPGLLGIATIASLYTRYPILKTLLYNEKLIQVDSVNSALQSNNAEQDFDVSFRNATFILSGSFFLSAVLNYGLARYLLTSQPGTEAFNAELGRMTALSFPVITIPTMIVSIGAFIYLYKKITKLTNLSLEEILVDPEAAKKQ